MSKSRFISKLIIPFILLIVYAVTLYNTATAPASPLVKEHIRVGLSKAPVSDQEIMSAMKVKPPAPPAFTQESGMDAQERVVGVIIGSVSRAYLLDDFGPELIVINDRGEHIPFVVFIDNQNGSAASFRAEIAGEELEFRVVGQKIVDDSGTIWDLSGKAIDGPLVGEQMKTLPTFIATWGEWSAAHPETSIYQK
jgi:hypothetical protein